MHDGSVRFCRGKAIDRGSTVGIGDGNEPRSTNGKIVLVP